MSLSHPYAGYLLTRNSAAEYIDTLVHNSAELRNASRLLPGEHKDFDSDNDDPGSMMSDGMCRAMASVLSNSS